MQRATHCLAWGKTNKGHQNLKNANKIDDRVYRCTKHIKQALSASPFRCMQQMVTTKTSTWHSSVYPCSYRIIKLAALNILQQSSWTHFQVWHCTWPCLGSSTLALVFQKIKHCWREFQERIHTHTQSSASCNIHETTKMSSENIKIPPQKKNHITAS